MDLDLSDDEQAVQDLAARILADHAPPERLRELESSGTWFAVDAWSALGSAGLLGLALGEDVGGAGLGVLEACLVAEQVGRHVAPVPYLTAVLAAAGAIDRFGSAQQRHDLLPGLAGGELLLAAALHEPGQPASPRLPRTTAERAAGRWRLRGAKAFVPLADRAARLVVPARTRDASAGVFLVDPTAAGVGLEEALAVTGEPQWTLRLDEVDVADADVLGDPLGGLEVVDHLRTHLHVGACAMQSGVCEGALTLTAAHVSEREQFGAKLGTFQAVAQRIADAYIDTEGVRLTARQAAWRLSSGLDATEALLVARTWATEAAQRVVHAAQHLHGGVGVDVDHPVHRYFRWAKVLELTVGGGTPSLLELGDHLAAGEPR